jgi:hypothetical protein
LGTPSALQPRRSCDARRTTKRTMRCLITVKKGQRRRSSPGAGLGVSHRYQQLASSQLRRPRLGFAIAIEEDELKRNNHSVREQKWEVEVEQPV